MPCFVKTSRPQQQADAARWFRKKPTGAARAVPVMLQVYFKHFLSRDRLHYPLVSRIARGFPTGRAKRAGRGAGADSVGESDENRSSAIQSGCAVRPQGCRRRRRKPRSRNGRARRCSCGFARRQVAPESETCSRQATRGDGAGYPHRAEGFGSVVDRGNQGRHSGGSTGADPEPAVRFRGAGDANDAVHRGFRRAHQPGARMQ